MPDELSPYRTKTLKDEHRLGRRRLRLANERIADLEEALHKIIDETDEESLGATIARIALGIEIPEVTL